LFFAVVGMVYDRAHIRDIPQLGGMVRKMPWAAVAFIIGGLVSMGMPGFSGFVSELPIFIGAWRAGSIAAWYPVIAVVAALAAPALAATTTTTVTLHTTTTTAPHRTTTTAEHRAATRHRGRRHVDYEVVLGIT
ncbi:MAG: hypothetical protein C4310_04360, partial [Chloroflexota bacterium]